MIHELILIDFFLKTIRNCGATAIASSQDIRGADYPVDCPAIIPLMLHSIQKPLVLYGAAIILSGGAFSHADDGALQAIRDGGGIVRSLGGGWGIEFQRKGKAMGDETLAQVALLGESVLALNLRGTRTSDEGLKLLANLRNLGRLHLERTEVGDGGMAHLAGLTNLEYLNLYGTKVTDAGLVHLESLQKLERLYVWQTGVTDEGCGDLARVLPKLKIVRGVNLDKVAAEAGARKKMAKAKEKKIVRVELKWVPAGTKTPPRSTGGGTLSSISIENTRSEAVKLYWVEYGGGLKYYAEIAGGGTLTRGTFSKATWLIADLNERPLGYFIATVEPSRVAIPR